MLWCGWVGGESCRELGVAKRKLRRWQVCLLPLRPQVLTLAC